VHASAAQPLPYPPRGLAKRVHIMPAGINEVAFSHGGFFSPDGYRPSAGASVLRYSLGRQLEVRNLGLFYAPVNGRHPYPEIGLGASLGAIEWSQATGIGTVLTASIELRQHFGDTRTLQLRAQYALDLRGISSGLTHQTTLGLDAQVDLPPWITLLVTMEHVFRYQEETAERSASNRDALQPAAGIHLAPHDQVDLRVHGGPVFTYSNRASEPAVGGRISVVFRTRWY
jgi:hypothetical protein